MDTTRNTNSAESIGQTGTERLRIRTRAIVDEWFILVVVTLLALSLLGGWGAYTAFAAEPTDETETAKTWSTTGGFEHSAVVQEENEVFEVGTDLTDRSTYFTTITPELKGEFRYGYESSDGDVTIDVELERVVRSVDDRTAYWSINDTLETTTAEGVGPGDEQLASFSIDVPATENRTERIEDSLEASPGTVETVVTADVTMTGTINGDSIEQTAVYELQLDPDGDVYHVDGPIADRWSSGGEETDEPAAAGSFRFLGPVSSVVVLIASLGALGVVAVTKKQGTLAPSQNERERLRVESERETFDDWISRGSIPNNLHDRSRIVVETLEDLVDIAIDCDRRVIEDGRLYYVVDGELLYIYESESTSEASAFDGKHESETGDRVVTDDEGSTVSTRDDEEMPTT